MKLPNAEHTIVEREKINDYLLNPAHPDFKRITVVKQEDFAFDPRLLAGSAQV